MPAPRLNAENYKTLKPRPGRERDVFRDLGRGCVEGLALRVTSAGSRTWWFIYQRDGKKRWLYLRDTEHADLAEARRLARSERLLLDRGLDPIEERARLERERRAAEEDRRLEAAGTLANIVSRYIDTFAERWSPKTVTERRRIARKHLAAMPSCVKPAAAVRRFEIADDLRAIGGIQANRVRELLSAASRWAAGEDRLAFDVMAGIKNVADEESRTRTLTDAEIKTLWKALDSVDRDTAAYLRVLLVCGTRRHETAVADWSEFDFKARLWRIPPDHRKGRRSGPRQRQGLDVPLSDLAFEVVGALSRKPSGRVFRALIAAAPGRIMERVRVALNIKKDSSADFTLHDLRRTAATQWQALGVRPEVISRLLGQQAERQPGEAKATATYTHAELWPERESAAEAWAARLRSLLAAEPMTGEVVAFRKQRGRR